MKRWAGGGRRDEGEEEVLEEAEEGEEGEGEEKNGEDVLVTVVDNWEGSKRGT